MKQVLIVVQMIVSVLLIGLILIQARGTGFGRTVGAGASSFTRRGLEKIVFRSTFILAFIFIVISISLLVF